MPFDSMPLTNKTIQKLEKMYELLNRRGGWCQKEFNFNDKEFCLLGVGQYVGFFPTDIDAFNENTQKFNRKFTVERNRFVKLLGFESVDKVIKYNDQRGRRKYQILNLVQDVIDREREKLLV